MIKGLISFLMIFGLSFQCLGFTLVSPNPPRYTSDEIFLDFAADSCTNTGFSSDDLHTMAEEAVEQYWNKVSTSRLLLKKGIRISSSTNGLSLGEVASLAGDNRILIGCNDDIAEFAGGGVLAVGGILSVETGKVKGAVLINDHTSSGLSTLSRSELLAVFAHELGHAMGIGHSADEIALMYFSIGNKIQEQMTQDDFDGLTYLYPHEKKLGGLAGSCGSIRDEGNIGNLNNIGNSQFSLPLVWELALGFILFSMLQIMMQGFSSFLKSVRLRRLFLR